MFSPKLMRDQRCEYCSRLKPILKYWGPMAGLNEFWGERMNGMLQRIKTNRHHYDMDYTMLCQMACRCWLMAYLHNSEFTDPQLKAFADILDVKDTTKPKKPEELDGFAIALYLSKAPKMTPKEYKSILSYLNSSGETSLSWLSYPDPEYRPWFFHQMRNGSRTTMRMGRRTAAILHTIPTAWSSFASPIPMRPQ
ncbi:hypothetical protein B0H10DRAFT_1967439 [Mycena sp. CBHHK59/15]|nr:hypothetical protein B0H10DRAFT_1967439 [Mycena sp. CBHHK59/15]